MKVKELLTVLTKDTKVCICYTFGKGFDPAKDEVPGFVLECEITYVNSNLARCSDYDLIIHINQDEYGEKLEDYMEENK